MSSTFTNSRNVLIKKMNNKSFFIRKEKSSVNNIDIKKFLFQKYKEIENLIIPINSYNLEYKYCRQRIHIGDTNDNDSLFKYTSLYHNNESVIFPPSPPPSNFFITWKQLNIIKIFLPIQRNEDFLNRFKIDLTCDKLIEFEDKHISALLVIESYEKSKMAKCMRKIKRGIYFNIDTKTVFKFLSKSENITEFIYEVLICSQYWLYIGTKKCLAFFPHVMCAEYSYEGPDIENIHVPNSLEIKNASYMYGCDDNDNTLPLQFAKNIQNYVNYNIIGIFKQILDIVFNLFSHGLTSIDLKPDNLSLNIHGEIKFIDVEFTYPIGTQLKRLKISQKKLRNKMKSHPQTAPEFFSGDYDLTEASTMYGLNFTFNRIIELVETSLDDIRKKNGQDVSNDLKKIEMIKCNKKFINLMNKSVKIDANKRPSIHEFYDVLTTFK